MRAMVSAPQPEATDAALDVLEAGGNVVDAAITAALVQTAIDPQMCGIAGFGSCHVHLADGTHSIIDFHGRAPRAATPTMWEPLLIRESDDGFGFILKGAVNEVGHESASTPLPLRAFDDVLPRWGTYDLAKAIQPAIGWCEDGFPIRPHVYNYWNRPSDCGRIPG